MTTVCRVAAAAGHSQVALRAMSDNRSALALYRSRGFRPRLDDPA